MNGDGRKIALQYRRYCFILCAYSFCGLDLFATRLLPWQSTRGRTNKVGHDVTGSLRRPRGTEALVHNPCKRPRWYACHWPIWPDDNILILQRAWCAQVNFERASYKPISGLGLDSDLILHLRVACRNSMCLPTAVNILKQHLHMARFAQFCRVLRGES